MRNEKSSIHNYHLFLNYGNNDNFSEIYNVVCIQLNSTPKQYMNIIVFDLMS